MADENEAAGPNGGTSAERQRQVDALVDHFTSDRPPPVLAVGGKRLTFIGDTGTVHVTLDEMLKSVIVRKDPIPLLLYGIVLKLSDVDRSLRTALKLSEDQIERAQGMARNPAEMVAQIFERLKAAGFSLPEVPPPGQGDGGS